jgi:hypothetical protein
MVAMIACGLAQSDMQFSITAEKESFRADGPMPMRWKLHNGTTQTWSVLAYFETPASRHFDAVRLHFTSDGMTNRLTIPLVGRRSAARPHTAALQPGEALEQRFDLQEFAPALAPGVYRVEAEYELGARWSAAIPSVNHPWTGKVKSSPIRIVITAR